jgi:hypothetical protein
LFDALYKGLIQTLRPIFFLDQNFSLLFYTVKTVVQCPYNVNFSFVFSFVVFVTFIIIIIKTNVNWLRKASDLTIWREPQTNQTNFSEKMKLRKFENWDFHALINILYFPVVSVQFSQLQYSTVEDNVEVNVRVTLSGQLERSVQLR